MTRTQCADDALQMVWTSLTSLTADDVQRVLDALSGPGHPITDRGEFKASVTLRHALSNMAVIIFIGPVGLWLRYLLPSRCPFAVWMWGGARILEEAHQKRPTGLLALSLTEVNLSAAAPLVVEEVQHISFCEIEALQSNGLVHANALKIVLAPCAKLGTVAFISDAKKVKCLRDSATPSAPLLLAKAVIESLNEGGEDDEGSGDDEVL